MTGRITRTGRQVRRPSVAEMVEATPLPEAWDYTVRAISESDIRNVSTVQAVLTTYMTELKQTIVFWNNHGLSGSESRTPIPGALNVIFWSTPDPTQHRPVERKYGYVFGYPMQSGQNDGYYYRESEGALGEPIIDENDQAAAILVDNVLHILFDLTHSDYNVKEVLTCIMDKVLETKKESKLTTAEKEALRLDTVVRNIAGARLKQALEREKENLRTNRHTLEAHEREMSSYATRVAVLNKSIKGKEEELAKFSPEHIAQSIMAIPGVVKVAPFRNNLRVATDTIFIDTEVARYKLGEYHIDYMPSGDYQILAVDRDHTANVSGVDHPHINGGKPCLGNVAEISVNVASGELDVATALIMDFLRSYTPGGAFTSLDKWPQVATIRKGVFTELDEPIRGWIREGERDWSDSGDEEEEDEE